MGGKAIWEALSQFKEATGDLGANGLTLASHSQVKAELKCGMWLDYDMPRRSNQKRKEEVLEQGLDICSKSWFILERRLNGQRQQPGGIQFRHDNSRIE